MASVHKKLLKEPVWMSHIVRAVPAPSRDHYHTGSDYSAACLRCHDRRLKMLRAEIWIEKD